MGFNINCDCAGLSEREGREGGGDILAESDVSVTEWSRLSVNSFTGT